MLHNFAQVAQVEPWIVARHVVILGLYLRATIVVRNGRVRHLLCEIHGALRQKKLPIPYILLRPHGIRQNGNPDNFTH